MSQTDTAVYLQILRKFSNSSRKIRHHKHKPHSKWGSGAAMSSRRTNAYHEAPLNNRHLSIWPSILQRSLRKISVLQNFFIRKQFIMVHKLFYQCFPFCLPLPLVKDISLITEVTKLVFPLSHNILLLVIFSICRK